MRGQGHRGGFTLPLILIALGVVLLLNNLGQLSWDVWEQIVRLWPILLIAAGLDLMIGRGALRWWLAVLVFVVILGGAALAVLDLAIPGTEQSISQGLGDATRAKVELSCNACALRLASNSDSENLIEGTVRLGWNENLRRSFRIADGTAEFTLESKKSNPFPSLWGGHGRDWTLWMNPKVPINLKVRAGVGDSILNLERLTLTRLEIRTDIGETTVTLPSRGRFQASITGGVKEIVVRVPEGLGMRVHLDTGVGDIDLPSDYLHQGDTYLSPDYETAEHRVDLKVKSGVGEVTIRKQSSI